MKPYQLALTYLALATSPVLAQQLPEIAGLDWGTPSSWSQTTEDGLAALRWGEAPGEHTLLMVHTTIDAEVAGAVVAEGVQKALPFMVSPAGAGWTVSHPVFAAAAQQLGYEFSGSDAVIPPERVVSFVGKFIASGYSSAYGTHNQGSTEVTRHVGHHFVALPVGAKASDERQPWARTSWWLQQDSGFDFDGFATSQLGRESVNQAVHEFAERYGLGPVDDAGIEKLNHLLDLKLGFEIYVQAISVVPSTGPGDPDRIKFKRYVRIRRYSLFGDENDYWALVKGGPRHVPDLLDAARNVYLAPLGDEMHIVFPGPVSSILRPAPLRAYVPTVNGYAIVQQTPNPVLHGVLQRPDIAIFACPPDATFGVVLIEDEQSPGVPVLPLGANGLGARIWVYAPPQ